MCRPPLCVQVPLARSGKHAGQAERIGLRCVCPEVCGKGRPFPVGNCWRKTSSDLLSMETEKKEFTAALQAPKGSLPSLKIGFVRRRAWKPPTFGVLLWDPSFIWTFPSLFLFWKHGRLKVQPLKIQPSDSLKNLYWSKVSVTHPSRLEINTY